MRGSPMADVHSPSQRSFNMSRIRGRDTKPEKLLRSLLHRRGFRFRKNVTSLPGRPDIVLPRYQAVVLVHGCYWHRHPGCRFTTTPATNAPFWIKKFKDTVARDGAAEQALAATGWRVFTVWECALREDAGAAVERLISAIIRK
ncbi:MAG: very short patch repair endonuclease [Allosphingosinicella sp.]